MGAVQKRVCHWNHPLPCTWMKNVLPSNNDKSDWNVLDANKLVMRGMNGLCNNEPNKILYV